MAALCRCTIASTVAYFMTVDPAWFAEHQVAQMLAQNPDMSKEQIAQAQAFMPVCLQGFDHSGKAFGKFGVAA